MTQMVFARNKLLIASLAYIAWLSTPAKAQTYTAVPIQSFQTPSDTLALRHAAAKDNALYVMSREGELFVYNTTQLSVGPISQTHTIYGLIPIVIGNYLYVGGSGFTVFEISKPLQPVYIGRFLTAIYPSDMMLLNNNRLVTMGGTSRSFSSVSFIDVSSPADPKLLSTTDFSTPQKLGSHFFAMGASEDHLFITELSGVYGSTRYARVRRPLPHR